MMISVRGKRNASTLQVKIIHTAPLRRSIYHQGTPALLPSLVGQFGSALLCAVPPGAAAAAAAALPLPSGPGALMTKLPLEVITPPQMSGSPPGGLAALDAREVAWPGWAGTGVG